MKEKQNWHNLPTVRMTNFILFCFFCVLFVKASVSGMLFHFFFIMKLAYMSLPISLNWLFLYLPTSSCAITKCQTDCSRFSFLFWNNEYLFQQFPSDLSVNYFLYLYFCCNPYYLFLWRWLFNIFIYAFSNIPSSGNCFLVPHQSQQQGI